MFSHIMIGTNDLPGAKAFYDEQVDAWHAAGIAPGGTSCEDPPGIREGATGRLYLACLRELDGHKLCGLYRMPRA